MSGMFFFFFKRRGRHRRCSGAGSSDVCSSDLAAPPVPKEGEGPRKNASGLLLMDSSLRPAWCNAEAIRILSYPDKLANLTPDVLLTARIQSSLVSRQARGESPFVSEFWSGRRRYSCRSLFLDS